MSESGAKKSIRRLLVSIARSGEADASGRWRADQNQEAAHVGGDQTNLVAREFESAVDDERLGSLENKFERFFEALRIMSLRLG